MRLIFQITKHICHILKLKFWNCCISVSVLNFIHQDVKSPNNVYLFRLLTTLFVLSFVLSSNNKNSFAGLHASWKCQLCTDHAGGKIQMTKFKIVKQHICLATKMSPISFWLYRTFNTTDTLTSRNQKLATWLSIFHTWI